MASLNSTTTLVLTFAANPGPGVMDLTYAGMYAAPEPSGVDPSLKTPENVLKVIRCPPPAKFPLMEIPATLFIVLPISNMYGLLATKSAAGSNTIAFVSPS